MPIYMVSPCAAQSMAYSTIVAEWLTRGRQDSAYEARAPFAHTDYIRDGRIITLASPYAHGHGHDNGNLSSTSSATPTSVSVSSSSSSRGQWNNGAPCIVLASHPSLRFGPILHFLKWYAARSTYIRYYCMHSISIYVLCACMYV